ncbi:MAG: hypothetical protein WBQ66_18630, partial [Blastocatellia bacterium]
KAAIHAALQSASRTGLEGPYASRIVKRRLTPLLLMLVPVAAQSQAVSGSPLLHHRFERWLSA